MSVRFFVEEIDFKLRDRRKLSSWIKYVCEIENKTIGSINYILTSNGVILDINKKYLKHDYYTDIITFNYNEGKLLSGDIYISLPKVFENSAEYGTLFHQELCRVIVHGVLHLIGYDDVNEELKSFMTLKENEMLLAMDQKFSIKELSYSLQI